MFSHIMIGTNDLDRAKTFYDAALGALGASLLEVCDAHGLPMETACDFLLSLSAPWWRMAQPDDLHDRGWHSTHG